MTIAVKRNRLTSSLDVGHWETADNQQQEQQQDKPTAPGEWPIWLAWLLDQIFETLPNGEAQQFSIDWPKAIPEGENLDITLHQFLHALLVDPVGGVIRHAPDSPAILAVADLHQRAINGDTITPSEWRSAARSAAAEACWAANSGRSAAEAAHWAACWAADRSAAEEAHWAAAEAEEDAEAAEAAEAAHRAARSAVNSGRSAEAAAEAARWQRDLLLQLLRSVTISVD